MLMARGFVTLACVMFIYSRKSLSCVIANTPDASFTFDTYTEAVRFYRSLESKNTAQGSRLRSGVFVVRLAKPDAKLRLHGKSG